MPSNHKSGMIEQYGTGLKRVRRMFVDYGLPQPTFETIPGGFAVTVFAKQNEINDIENEKEKLGENSLIILNLLKANNKITIIELAKVVGISVTAIENNLSKLKRSGQLKRVGSAKGGYWLVIER